MSSSYAARSGGSGMYYCYSVYPSSERGHIVLSKALHLLVEKQGHVNSIVLRLKGAPETV